jgi:hypothetical protein
MTDEDDEAKNKAFLEAYNAKLEAGEPMMTFAFHEILKLWIAPTGEMLIDFVFAKSPDNRVVVARAVMGSASTRMLKAALVENENIPDTLPTEREKESKH